MQKPIQNQLEEIRNLEAEYQSVLNKYEIEKLALKAKYIRELKEIMDQRSLLIKKLSDMQNNTKFWMKVLLNSNSTKNMINPKDLEVLKHLNNVEVLYTDTGLKNLKIIFDFEPNEYFSNTYLEKEYFFSDDNLIESINSTKIQWKNGKNYFSEKVKKKIKNKKTNEIKEIEIPKNSPSFFNFFYDFDFPNKSDLKKLSVMKEKEFFEFLDEEYQLIYELKDEILPFASEYYVGVIQDNELYADYLEKNITEL